MHFKVANMLPGENAAPMHPFCRCSVAAYSDRKEYDEWLNYLEQGGTTEEYNKLKAAKSNKKRNIVPNIDKLPKSGIINTRNMSSGLRKSPYYTLTDNDIESLKSDAASLNIPENVLMFNNGNKTGFDEKNMRINVKGDVLPDLNSDNVRDLLSQKAVLAHEYYGHYKNHPSPFPIDDWRDEFRASYNAAINAPNLTAEERRMLMLDAYLRAKEAGVSVIYNKRARSMIYGFND